MKQSAVKNTMRGKHVTLIRVGQLGNAANDAIG
jgi:hypothetical protein